MMLGTGLGLERQNTVALSFPFFNHDYSRTERDHCQAVGYFTTVDVAQNDRASQLQYFAHYTFHV
jgi:hypothetical protein